MKGEVVIVRHVAGEGPGYLADFLDRHRIRWRLIRIDRREVLPERLGDIPGLVFMGGPMSVNDNLPWIPRALNLIRTAVAAGRPVLGHCLGGQLMSKALGGRVTRNRVKEIGWLPVETVPGPGAARWLDGLPARFEAFHWHGETFSIPRGATRLLESRACRNQAFAIGNSLGLQCHVEMTAAMVRGWAHAGGAEIARPSATVHSRQRMQAGLPARLERLHHVADALYSRWIEGLR